MSTDAGIVMSDGPVEGTAPLRAGPAALIRDIILGGQDGLVNVLGLVLGMAVATGDTRVVVTAGLAALLAESIAMAGVAYTSSGAERQLGDAVRLRFRLERESLIAGRAASRRVRLAGAGLSPEARAVVEKETAEEVAAWTGQLERERDALSPVREHRPVRVAAVVGVSTALGSAVPLLPFLLLPVGTAAPVALVLSSAVLAVAGVERAALTGGSYRRAAFEMLVIGLVSALAGYLIGQLLRVPGA
jgi:VIT1/CCC1 family predicted Fe2+/Mn2+ transporter